MAARSWNLRPPKHQRPESAPDSTQQSLGIVQPPVGRPAYISNFAGGCIKLTKTLALLIFCICSVNVRAIENLHGLVRSVETTSAQGTENINTRSPSELEIYDPDGFLIEQYRYDDAGRVWGHTYVTRNGSTVKESIESITDSTNPEESRTVVTRSDPQNGVTIREEYDVHGTLRSKLQSGPEGSTFRQSEHDRSVGNSQTVIVKYKYDPATGRTTSTTTKEGNVIFRSSSQWSKAGAAMVTTQPDGSFTEISSMPASQKNPNGSLRKLHFYTSSTKTDFLLIADDQGRTLETLQDSPDSYVKDSYTYDDQGLMATESMSDRDGKVTMKFRYEYQIDPHGNWVEQRRSTWRSSDTPPEWTQDMTVRRVITYY